MICKPYERVSLNTQNGVVDCGNPPTVSFGGEGNTLFLHSTNVGNAAISLADYQQGVVLHVDVDKEETVPMIVKECGYEWVPVYSRKMS